MTSEEISELRELLFRQSSYQDDDGLMEMIRKHQRFGTIEKKYSRAVVLLNKILDEGGDL